MKKKYDIAYEDNHLLIVNKPAGMLVQGDKTGDDSLIDHYKEYVRKKYNKPGNIFLGLVHRIDRPVSGLVVLAKTSKGLERMSRLFQDKKIKKTYWALVKTRPPLETDTLTHWLWKDTNKNITRVHGGGKKGAKQSVLTYNLLGRLGEFYLLEVNPVTGRAHQIRAQLAAIKCPIVGDVKYGFPGKNREGSIMLHAQALSFEHPVKKEPIELVLNPGNHPSWLLFRDFYH